MPPIQSAPDLPELLYLFDPLCGWCYGMSPVIQRVRQEFAGRVEVSVLCGGMVTGEQAALNGSLIVNVVAWAATAPSAKRMDRCFIVGFTLKRVCLPASDLPPSPSVQPVPGHRRYKSRFGNPVPRIAHEAPPRNQHGKL